MFTALFFKITTIKKTDRSVFLTFILHILRNAVFYSTCSVLFVTYSTALPHIPPVRDERHCSVRAVAEHRLLLQEKGLHGRPARKYCRWTGCQQRCRYIVYSNISPSTSSSIRGVSANFVLKLRENLNAPIVNGIQ